VEAEEGCWLASLQISARQNTVTLQSSMQSSNALKQLDSRCRALVPCKLCSRCSALRFVTSLTSVQEDRALNESAPSSDHALSARFSPRALKLRAKVGSASRAVVTQKNAV
jgi:hypothetical protein